MAIKQLKKHDSGLLVTLLKNLVFHIQFYDLILELGLRQIGHWIAGKLLLLSYSYLGDLPLQVYLSSK